MFLQELTEFLAQKGKGKQAVGGGDGGSIFKVWAVTVGVQHRETNMGGSMRKHQGFKKQSVSPAIRAICSRREWNPELVDPVFRFPYKNVNHGYVFACKLTYTQGPEGH